jgi:hypothetical protein
MLAKAKPRGRHATGEILVNRRSILGRVRIPAKTRCRCDSAWRTMPGRIGRFHGPRSVRPGSVYAPASRKLRRTRLTLVGVAAPREAAKAKDGGHDRGATFQ